MERVWCGPLACRVGSQRHGGGAGRSVFVTVLWAWTVLKKGSDGLNEVSR